MRYAALILAAISWACSGATGPKGLDPSILVTNLSSDTALVIWASDVGFDTVKVPPLTRGTCTRWTQTFDSLYSKVAAGSSSVVTPWLHFAEYPYYFQVDTIWGANGDGTTPGRITNHIVSTEC